MKEEIGIQQIVERDDVKLAEKYLEIVGSPNHLHKNGDGVDDVSATWIAAAFDARNVTRMFVERGGDLEFTADSINVRSIGLLKPQALLGMIEGGMKPTNIELSRIYLIGVGNDIPNNKRVEIAKRLAELDPEISPDRNVSVIRGYIKNEEFVALFAQLSDIDPDDLSQMLKAKGTRKKSADMIMHMYQSMSLLIQNGAGYLAKHGQEIDKIILRRFSGYRKNRSWLIHSSIQARDEICSLLAPIYDLYEDDDDLCFACDLILARYPIKERLAGTGNREPSRLSGQVFEREVAEQLKTIGFSVQKVGQTGDQGADVIAEKDGLRFAIQCKDYSTPVGNAAVQQALSAMSFYKTDYAVVCAPAGFTKSAKRLGVTANVILIPPNMLPQLMSLRHMAE